MNKTRLMMLVGVILLSLALVSMALAADSAQKPNPPQQVATTGVSPAGGGIQNIGNSGVNFIDPDSFSQAGGTVDLCFNVHVDSPDAEYLDGFDFDLPDDWTVNSVTDVPPTGCTNGHTYGVNPGNVVYWYTNGMPSSCGDWNVGDYNFCANVTFPAGCTASWDLPWNYYGDTWGNPPHSTSGSALATCELPVGPLAVEKSATPAVLPGDPIDYSITINNTSPDEVLASMVDAIPVGTTFVPGSLTCDSGECSYDAGSNSVLWDGTLSGSGQVSGGNVNSLTGSYVAFDPTVGGDTCSVSGEDQTFCFKAESWTPDFAYVYNVFEKFPADWQVLNAYVQGTPVCDVGSWGAFSWTYQTIPNEINLNHARYQATTDHCIAYYCFDVVTGSAPGLESWYWTGDDFGNPPDHPCSSDIYTPAGYDACDESINPQASIPSCGPTSAVTINFQATAGAECPVVVSNTAVVSSEDNPDVFATADTNVYCSFDPDIVVSPLSLLAEQPVNTITTQQLQICNEGPSQLDWSLTEVPGMKVTSVTPAPSSKQPSAVNKPANVSRDPAITRTPAAPTADILLNQVPDLVNGIFVDSTCALCPTGMQSVADNFTFEADGVIEQLIFWSGYYPSDTEMNPDTFRVLFHEDSAGLPGAVVYDENNVTYTRFETGVMLFGVHEWQHTLTFATPVNLPAGTYWVEIFNTAAPDDFFWETGAVDTMGRGGFDSAWAEETPGVTWLFPDGYEQSMQILGTIGVAEGIPWLDEAPTSGSVAPFTCTFVDVSFNSAGLIPGLYTGELDVNSNDPDTPVVPVDVALNVVESPDIAVDPTSLTADLPPDQQQSQDLNVCNVGQSPLDWTLTEALGMKVNSVTTVQAGAKPSHPVTLALDANDIAGPTGPAPKTPNADVALVLDDGSRDNDIGIGGLQEFIWVNRFTPNASDFPFQVNEVWIYFSSLGLVNVGDSIKIVFYENTTGGFDPAPGSNYLGGYLTTVQALDTWNVYTLPTPVGFSGPTGDAIIGVIGLEVPGSSYWPASIDQTTTQQRSWAGWWNVMPPPDPPLLPPDASWILIDDFFPGNWMVRAYGTTGDDVLPWLSEVPTEGTVQPGDCAIVNVTFDSTGLGYGTYSGFLDIASNDPDEPIVDVPVTLNVVAPDISVNPDSLDLALFPNEVDTLNFTIENLGGADLTWDATEVATWLSLLPTSGTLLPGESIDVVATFDSTDLLPDVYNADITITSNDPDTPEVLLPVTLTVNPLDSDLSVVKTANADVVSLGDTITYTLVISNAGGDDAIGVTLVDMLPDLVTFVSASEGCTELEGVVTCDIGGLAMDESVTLTIVVTAVGSGIAENTAEVSSGFVADPDLTNNTSTVETMVLYNYYLPIVLKH